MNWIRFFVSEVSSFVANSVNGFKSIYLFNSKYKEWISIYRPKTGEKFEEISLNVKI